MKAKELMIGDWVFLKNGKVLQPCKVTVIGNATQNRNEIGISVCLDTSDEFPTCIFEIDEISPIPFTAKILEKNGFKRDPFWHHCDKDLENYSISVQLGYANRIKYIKIAEKGKDNVIPSEKTKLYLTHIKYVHQFQHALRLCGINKEIVL